MQTHSMNSEAEILNFWKQPWDSQGSGRFPTVSQGAIGISDGNWKDGHFAKGL